MPPALESSPPFDLLVRAGRVVCPSTGLDAPGAVAICGDRIVAAGPGIDGPSRRTLEFPDAILLPGLIDLHAHPSRAGSQFGVDPDEWLLQRGTTTVLSQGDAGAANCEAYVRETIAVSRTRIRLALNLSSRGEAGPGGCFEKLEWIDVDACVRTVERFREHIWGLAVNCSHHACGTTDPQDVLRRGKAAAERSGLPLLYGLRRPEDWPLADQLAELRPGDVVTYCFRRTPHGIVQQGRVLECVREARARGILFDVGHGLGSFDFATAAAAVADGFPPDTISTDWQRGHLDRRMDHDLPLVMSKLRAVGMSAADVFRAVTTRPAQILGLAEEIGSLTPGRCADLVVLRRQRDVVPLEDVDGNVRSGERWEASITVRGGIVLTSQTSCSDVDAV